MSGTRESPGFSDGEDVNNLDYPCTMTPEDRLRELGHVLPPAPKSVANYVGSVQTGNLLFLSGKGPDLAGGRTWQGKLGKDFTTEEGYTAARDTMLNLLAVIKTDIGERARVTRVVQDR